MIHYRTILNADSLLSEDDKGILLLLLYHKIDLPVRNKTGWECHYCEFTAPDLYTIAEHLLTEHES